jgi:DNA-binding MarR family transcriptional regulator
MIDAIQVGGMSLPPHVSSAEILASPAFSHAQALYLDLYEAPFKNNPFLVRLFGSAGRSVAFLTALRLAALQVPGDETTLLTPRRMQEVAVRSRVIRPRTMTNALARLRATGYLKSSPVPGDRRQSALQPTEKALTYYRDWVSAHIRPLAMIFPDRNYSAGVNGEPDFLLAQRRAGARVIARSGEVLARNPDIMLFLTRDAGYFILTILLQQVRDSGGLSAAPLGALSDRFGISRTHVRKVLQTAQAAGLLDILAPGARKVAVTRRLSESFDRYFADLLSVTDLIYAIAVERR